MIMGVQAASLEILEKAALPPAQARAIVQAIEIEIAGAKDTLATKHDVLLLRHEVTEKLSELRIEIHATSGSQLRQMYAAMLGQLAVLLGVSYFFLSHFTR
jgi:hypothetical protein